MPNWCEGNIRLRGTQRGIAEFLRNELEFVADLRGNIFQRITRELEFDEDKYGDITLRWPSDVGDVVWPSSYIKGTHRNFIDGSPIEVYVGGLDDWEIQTVCIDGFKAAWGIEAEPYREKARKYGIDIRIVGFERGMEFMQDVEIVNGEIVRDDRMEYDDWYWECPMPNMGG